MYNVLFDFQNCKLQHVHHFCLEMNYNVTTSHLVIICVQWVGSIDLVANEEADANVVVQPAASWEEQEKAVATGVAAELGDSKVDAILCVAGGWAGGNAASDSECQCL